MLDEKTALAAARAIAICPKDRLPYVLATLEKVGIHFDPDDLPVVKPREIKKTSYLVEQRATQNRDRWLPTDNPYLLKYREAYERGISLTHLGRKVGRQKAAMYQYLYGATSPSPALWEKICAEIFKEFPDLDPRNSKEKPFWEE